MERGELGGRRHAEVRVWAVGGSSGLGQCRIMGLVRTCRKELADQMTQTISMGDMARASAPSTYGSVRVGGRMAMVRVRAKRTRKDAR